MHVAVVVPASILAQSLACHWAEEVNGPHAYGLNGPWLIDRQTDDLNEWRERIKCLSSSPFIPLSRPPFISRSFRGEGLMYVGGFVWKRQDHSGWLWKPVGILLLTCGPLKCLVGRPYRQTPHDPSCTLNNENIQLI